MGSRLIPLCLMLLLGACGTTGQGLAPIPIKVGEGDKVRTIGWQSSVVVEVKNAMGPNTTDTIHYLCPEAEPKDMSRCKVLTPHYAQGPGPVEALGPAAISGAAFVGATYLHADAIRDVGKAQAEAMVKAAEVRKPDTTSITLSNSGANSNASASAQQDQKQDAAASAAAEGGAGGTGGNAGDVNVSAQGGSGGAGGNSSSDNIAGDTNISNNAASSAASETGPVTANGGDSSSSANGGNVGPIDVGANVGDVSGGSNAVGDITATGTGNADAAASAAAEGGAGGNTCPYTSCTGDGS